MPEAGPARALLHFLTQSRFRTAGAVMTDLDGTALHESAGRAAIPPEVANGLRALGRPIILNTLRFPANVVRSFGREWQAIQGGPVALVSLNGGIGGMIDATPSGMLGFEEVFAEVLSPADIEGVLGELEAEIDAGAADPLLFFHARDWRRGETLWTPDGARVPALRVEYPHADRVISTDLTELRDELHRRDLCLMLMPHGDLPIYQQQRRKDFYTASHADKLSGAQRMAVAQGIDLASSIGAGDTAMDVFLGATGLAIRVGASDLLYEGLVGTLDVPDARGFGLAMATLAALMAG